MDETSSSQRKVAASLKQEQWRAVTELFSQCSGLTPEEREQLLAGADNSIAGEVRSLLENSDPDSDSFPSPADQILNPPQNLPAQFGAYRLERLLGQGGMGSVFLARRVEEFDQVVAVKLIRTDFGPASPALKTRFRQERQILASLQHPYISHLIDGGTSGTQPYLVVEYVPGVRIDEYCNQQRLSIRQRIDLFLKVCGAVQYAHQNLVVHRDLKPANVLVLQDGTPKLLDFGIAKLLSRDESVGGITRTEMKIFTPSYASPEQLRGEPAGTASDVYSLGVMLYELLTGQKPHLVDSDSDFAMLEAISRQTSPIASAAIKRYSEGVREARAAERSTTYSGWGRTLSNDLDLILSKAISADPNRRYPSVEQFSSDLNRYLAHLPIQARKDTWSYRAQKFWSRHKALMSVASLAFVLLAVAGFVLWREYRVAVMQRQRAERRFNDLRALARSNVTEVQDALDRVPGGTEVRALILQRTVQYLDSLAAEKDNDIDLQRDLASTYTILAQRLGNPAIGNLGDIDGASASYDRSIRIREAIVAQPEAKERDRLLLIFDRWQKGLMQVAAGQLEAARQTYARAAADSDANLAHNPKDVIRAYQFVAFTHRELAVVLVDGQQPNLADPIQALHHTDVAVHAAETVYHMQPNRWPQIEDYITATWMRADVLFAIGREEEGLKLERSNLDFANSLRVATPEKSKNFLIYPTYQYATHLAQKDPSSALPWADRAIAAITNARAADPADMRMLDFEAHANVNLGNVYLKAGKSEKGLKMMAVGISQLQDLLQKYPKDPRDWYYLLAAAHRSLGDNTLEHGNPRKALIEYEGAENLYAQHATIIHDDLAVNAKRSENQLTIAAMQAKLGMERQASASRILAVEYADRVLRIHPDNPVAQNLKLKAMALAF